MSKVGVSAPAVELWQALPRTPSKDLCWKEKRPQINKAHTTKLTRGRTFLDKIHFLIMVHCLSPSYVQKRTESNGSGTYLRVGGWVNWWNRLNTWAKMNTSDNESKNKQTQKGEFSSPRTRQMMCAGNFLKFCELTQLPFPHHETPRPTSDEIHTHLFLVGRNYTSRQCICTLCVKSPSFITAKT